MGKKYFAVFFFIFTIMMGASPCFAVEDAELTTLSLEELMEVKVTSVGKKAQNLSESAAAIFVITNEDIRRSGVTNIPDALRMVPGMHVGRIDSNKWAVNSRGLNGRFASHLKVLIDGRSTYTPTFSGVYWEVNDLFLEDVDRIEVIRGPGATLWGANAVNGVINIITKSSLDTQGGFVQAGTGNLETVLAGVRYGGKTGENTTWRIYAKQNNRDSFEDIPDGDAGDDWHVSRSGFRADTRLSGRDSLTVQGDVYKGKIHQELYLSTATAPYMSEFAVDTDVAGGNLLGRWKRTLSSSSDLTFQAYVDMTRREEDIINENRFTMDFDLQHRFAPGRNQDVVWGIKYRYTKDDFSDPEITDVVIFDSHPSSTGDQLFSAFLQDEISFLDDRFRVTLGSKFEHNEYTGFEMQPSISAIWLINPANRVWGAVSRAVRTPSRSETDARTLFRSYDYGLGYPVQIRVVGNEDYGSEELVAYELGYRFVPNKAFSLDAVAFFNDYNDFRTAEQPAGPQANVLTNTAQVETYGLDLAVGYRFSRMFKCDLGYAYLGHRMRNVIIGGFPRHQVSLRGQFDFGDHIEADIWFRYVSASKSTYLTEPVPGVYPIDEYLTTDIRLAWEVVPGMELSLVGRNLLEGGHTEATQEFFSTPVEVPRSVYGMVTYRF